MTTKRPLPPSPEYYRKFVREWPGGCSDDCTFRIVDGDVYPHAGGTGENVCIVGAEWLRRQAIPENALKAVD